MQRPPRSIAATTSPNPDAQRTPRDSFASSRHGAPRSESAPAARPRRKNSGSGQARRLSCGSTSSDDSFVVDPGALGKDRDLQWHHMLPPDINGGARLRKGAIDGDAATLIQVLRRCDAPIVHSGDEVFGRSALHYAAMYGRLEATRVLLEHGASVRAPDLSCCTPLHLAAERGHSTVVKVGTAPGPAYPVRRSTTRALTAWRMPPDESMLMLLTTHVYVHVYTCACACACHVCCCVSVMPVCAVPCHRYSSAKGVLPRWRTRPTAACRSTWRATTTTPRPH
jgi:hypothetical protein